jgi:hypothetical protein
MKLRIEHLTATRWIFAISTIEEQKVLPEVFDMYAAKIFMAGIVLLMLAVNAVDAREGNPYSDPLKSSVYEPVIAKEPGFGEDELMTPRLDLSVAPVIDITYINTWHAAAGNSDQVFVGIEITQLGTDIMGLDNTNFKVEPLFIPADGPGVRISFVEEISDAVHFYVLEMIPEQICKTVDYPSKTPAPCKQLTWMPGDYSLKLYYISEGKELADTLIDFTI